MQPRNLSLASLALALGACGASAGMLSAPRAEILRRVAASSVVVRTPTGFGSGTVIFNQDGAALVLTAHHVIAGIEPGPADVRVELGANHAEQATARARVIDADEKTDLALLQLDDPISLPALPIARGEPALYEEIFVVAAPLDNAHTAATGLLTAKRWSDDDLELWQITGLVFFGSSGGTVANTDGELVAMPTRVVVLGGLPIPELGFCVPLGAIQDFLRDTPYAADLALSGDAR